MDGVGLTMLIHGLTLMGHHATVSGCGVTPPPKKIVHLSMNVFVQNK